MLRKPNSKARFYMIVFRNTVRAEDYKQGSPSTFLFDYLRYEDSNGALGDSYRELLKPTFRVWQETGVSDCFETAAQAWAVVDAIEARQLRRHTNYDFRVVCRTITQTTTRVNRRVRSAA